MKKLRRIALEVLTAPLLLILLAISVIGQGAHAIGRRIADALDALEAQA